jgi:uncharacterized protein with von Willebrand factor type A (vWA) domain
MLSVTLSPALISLFRAYPDFGQTNAVSFSGPPAQNDDVALSDVERHSMVLIGERKTSEEYYFRGGRDDTSLENICTIVKHRSRSLRKRLPANAS